MPDHMSQQQACFPRVFSTLSRLNCNRRLHPPLLLASRTSPRRRPASIRAHGIGVFNRMAHLLGHRASCLPQMEVLLRRRTGRDAHSCISASPAFAPASLDRQGKGDVSPDVSHIAHGPCRR